VIDWTLAERVARFIQTIQASGDSNGALDYNALEPALIELSEASGEAISAYTGLEPFIPIPKARVVDRREWVYANLLTLRGILDPATEQIVKKSGVLGRSLEVVGGTFMAIEIGGLIGLLSQRVLGQYEFPPLDAEAQAQLLYVVPNLEKAANAMDAPFADFIQWVALHETTHAIQFCSVPWLREYIASNLGEVMELLQLNPRQLFRLPTTEDFGELIRAVKEGELQTFVLGAGQKEMVHQIQAFMAILEGYAEHVMDVVGSERITNLGRLRSSLDRRRKERTGFLRMLERLLGFELKLKQYEIGKRFCDEVAEIGGIETLNQVWESKEMMPTLAEVGEPKDWLKRVA
jgi:coenzyme F420 biosynthesis associated uncharacterized protein